MHLLKSAVVLVIILLLPIVSTALSHPHIVFIVADDLGWNDIGFHNPDIISPNIDQLASTGTIFNHSYVQPVCTPSRSAFMTSYYPFRMGLQNNRDFSDNAFNTMRNVNTETSPQTMSSTQCLSQHITPTPFSNGRPEKYKNEMAVKHDCEGPHLVITRSQNVCVPLNKTLLSEVFKKYGYATHIVGKWHLGYCKVECTPTYRGFDSFYGYFNSGEDYYAKVSEDAFDFHKDEAVEWRAAGNYSSYLYTEQVTNLVYSHNQSKPMFLYFPIQSVHRPLEVPDYYYNLYPNISNKNRRIFSGMVTALDDAIGKLLAALKKTGMYNDTIIFFTSDNGGLVPTSGNNYPLRGGKITIWEGGTRVPGFVHSPKYVKSGAVYDGVMHAVDWFPTIVDAAKMQHEDPDRDGMSQWQSITSLSESPRKEFVYNLDDFHPPTEGKAAIRIGDYKLIEGYPGAYNSWYPPKTMWTGYVPMSDYSDSQDLYESGGKNWTNFKGLYNLIDDPHERVNLYNHYPKIVSSMKERLKYYKMRMVPANYPKSDPASNPINFKGTWSPGWC